KEVAPALSEAVADRKRSAAERVEMLTALEALHDERLAEAMNVALAADDARLRAAGRRLLAKVRPAEAVVVLEEALAKGSVVDQQGALAILGEMPAKEADALLAKWLDRLSAGQVPAEAQLDLLEAAGLRSAAEVKRKLAAYEAARAKGDLLAR